MSDDDPTCLQCGERRSKVRAESLFCCTISGYETPEVDQEWERHRWRDWTDRQLDAAGIKPEVFDKHRRTLAGHLQWVDCDDLRRGHVLADAESVAAMFADREGQCIACGHQVEGAQS